MQKLDLIAEPWADYELLDSGDNRKLERYGAVNVIRPETQALWSPARPELWKNAAAEFRWADGKGEWSKGDLPERWELAWEDVRAALRLTSFKHTGIFPEQAPNWGWLRERVSGLGKPKVLNLFGYTGIASIVAAKAGAEVTHVDASKQTNVWARENAASSGLAEQAIRFLDEDARKFVEREVRRGASYDGIILDPPAFGRGTKGEVWRIEDDLPKLIASLAILLAARPGAFLLLNGYAAGYSARSFLQAVEGAFGSGLKGEFGELAMRESGAERVVPAGIYVRFVR
jgi:23S rRNA (cytosine1962-C5)-methyltransferase